METLYVRDQDDSFTRATREQVLHAARLILRQRLRVGAPVLDDPRALREFLCCRYGVLDHEVYGVVFLDARHRLIDIEEMFRGGVSSVNAPIGEVLKAALTHASSGVVAFHCHPSGCIEPSSDDQRHTRQLREALALVDIRLLDHVIVAGDRFYSFHEWGLLE